MQAGGFRRPRRRLMRVRSRSQESRSNAVQGTSSGVLWEFSWRSRAKEAEPLWKPGRWLSVKEEWSSLGMEMKRHPAELLQAVHLSLGCLQKSMEQQGCMNR